jgi:hypothetical protein
MLLVTALSFLLCGCSDSKEVEDAALANDASVFGLIARSTSIDSIAKSSATGRVAEPIVFTEKDIVWFNESTKEIRFKDNIAMKAALTNVMALKFYIIGDYLFSSHVLIGSSDTEITNSLVLYYSTAENKFYLLAGYFPPSGLELSPPGSRDNFMLTIATEWNKFINQLKKEKKHTS